MPDLLFEPKTATEETSYDRIEHHKVAVVAPNTIKNPRNAGLQFVSNVAFPTEEEQRVS